MTFLQRGLQANRLNHPISPPLGRRGSNAPSMAGPKFSAGVARGVQCSEAAAAVHRRDDCRTLCDCEHAVTRVASKEKQSLKDKGKRES
jgi:hypothetical protein